MHTFRMYVAPYSNTCGGRWLDLETDDVEADVSAISRNGALEVGAFDYEGFGSIRTESVMELIELAKAALTSQDAEAFVAYVSRTGQDAASAEGEFDDAYCGHWDDEGAFAVDLADEVMDIPERIRPYFDDERFARDLFLSDYFSAHSAKGGVFVFRHV
jgi:antirestriction protein